MLFFPVGCAPVGRTVGLRVAHHRLAAVSLLFVLIGLPAGCQVPEGPSPVVDLDAGRTASTAPDDGAADETISSGAGVDGGGAADSDATVVDVAPDQAEGTDGPPDVGGDVGSDTGPAVACKQESALSGPLLVYAGGPNFGSGAAVGVCGYPNKQLPAGRFFGAVDTALFAGAAACGACVHLQNADGTITADVQIIDQVNPALPTTGHVLSVDRAVHDMFATGGSDPVVQYRFVPCGVSGNIQVQFDTNTVSGSSLLIMNHRNPLADVEIETATGWKPLIRTPFNRWVIPFIISGSSNNVRFADTSQRSVDAVALPFSAGLQDSGVQLPPCL